MNIGNPKLINPALLSQQAPNAAPSPAKGMDSKRMDETAKDFEAMFLSEMLRPVFETVEVDKTFGGGRGEQVFRSFLVTEYGKSLAEVGTTGIADLVKEQLIALQSRADEQNLAQNMHGKV